MKKLCVFGCLLTEEGIKIKEEMLIWLEQYYDVLCINQKPPGELYEYPAINMCIKMAIDMNEPVLYIHTKGAANPEGQRNLQKKIRKIWKCEFTTNINKYFGNYSGVMTPFTGINKETWFNAFVLYPDAAQELKQSFHIDKNRFYYERLFSNTEIKVTGIINDKLDSIESSSNNNTNVVDFIEQYKVKYGRY